MRDGTDRIPHGTETGHLPFRLVQRASRASSLVRLLLVSPALIALAVPLLIGARAAAEPQVLALVSDRPLAALQIAFACIAWAALFGWPLVAIARRLGASRTIEVDAFSVRVVDRSLIGTREWCAPVASYRGIAHHVRTSLSGVRHELVLVHPDPSRNVLIAVADRLSQSALEQATSLLRLPEIPAAALYGRSIRGSRTTASSLHPAPAH